MRLHEMKQEMFASLDKYEDSIRRYCDKVDEDRPWVGEAIWQSCWHFRRAMLEDIHFLEQSLKLAKNSKDPG